MKITTYGREGRWVTDISPALALLKDGGARRFVLSAPAQGEELHTVLTLRLLNRDKGMRPVAFLPLYGGGSFDATFNERYAPLIVNPPAGTKKVEVFAFVSGHGWGVELKNCAEFCNHTHHFSVNGTGFVKTHPLAGSQLGCAGRFRKG